MIRSQPRKGARLHNFYLFINSAIFLPDPSVNRHFTGLRVELEVEDPSTSLLKLGTIGTVASLATVTEGNPAKIAKEISTVISTSCHPLNSSFLFHLRKKSSIECLTLRSISLLSPDRVRISEKHMFLQCMVHKSNPISSVDVLRINFIARIFKPLNLVSFNAPHAALFTETFISASAKKPKTSFRFSRAITILNGYHVRELLMQFMTVVFVVVFTTDRKLMD